LQEATGDQIYQELCFNYLQNQLINLQSLTNTSATTFGSYATIAAGATVTYSIPLSCMILDQIKFFTGSLGLAGLIVEVLSNGPACVITPVATPAGINLVASRLISFSICIKTANFKYYKCFPSRVEAETELIRQNHENKLEIKNIMRDWGDYYAVKLPYSKEFLADKIDLHFIESHIWNCDNNYVNCKKNKALVKFHNIILGHSPTIGLHKQESIR